MTQTQFGDLLRMHRRRAHLSSAQLAEAVGYSLAQLLALEAGYRVPDADVLLALFVPVLGLQTEQDAVAQFLNAAADLRSDHQVIVTFETAQEGSAEDDWWTHCSSDARTLAAILYTLKVPVDAQSAIVCECGDGVADLRAAGRELLRLNVISSLSEAVVPEAGRERFCAQLSQHELRSAHSAAARISERMFNDFVGAICHWLAADSPAHAVDVVFDRIDLMAARGELRAVADALLDAHQHARRNMNIAAAGRIACTRGEALLVLGEDADAERVLREGVSYARPAERRARINMQIAHLLIRSGRASDALQVLQEALASLTALDTLLLCRASVLHAQAHQQLGQNDIAADKAERALWLADALGTAGQPLCDDARASADAVIAATHRLRGHLALALHHYDRAAQAAARCSAVRTQFAAHLNAAHLWIETGSPASARHHLDAALACSEAQSDLSGRARALYLLGLVNYWSGNVAEARDALHRSLALRRRLNDSTGQTLSQVALIRACVDRDDQTLPDVQQAQALAHALVLETQHAEPLWRACALDALLYVQLALGDLTAAHTSLDGLQRAALTAHHPLLEATVRNRQAAFALLRGLALDALKLSSKPVVLAGGHDVEADRQVVEALALCELGDRMLAPQYLENTLRYADSHGLGRYVRIVTRTQQALVEHQHIDSAQLYFYLPPVRGSAAQPSWPPSGESSSR